MTKGECILMEMNFERDYSSDREEKKHDGSSYTVRVYRADYSGNYWKAECDSYYGRTMLFVNGKFVGEYETRYEQIRSLIESFLPNLAVS